MKSQSFDLKQNNRGNVVSLKMMQDNSQMNWVIDPDYLKQVGYEDNDKLFGEFTITVDGKVFQSIDFEPTVTFGIFKSIVTYHVANIAFKFIYQLMDNHIKWQINISNKQNSTVEISNLGVWTSFSYIMFRDKNVHRNANKSAAAFPSISKNFTKLALVRRDNTAPNLGLYQTDGDMRSIGTYAEYSNRFFDNVSPSLDGMLFHQLILAGGYSDDQAPQKDWIYSQEGITLDGGDSKKWEFVLAPFKNQLDFYHVGQRFGHPTIQFYPLVNDGQKQRITVGGLEDFVVIDKVEDIFESNDRLQAIDITHFYEKGSLIYNVRGVGEHKVLFTFADGKQDMLIFNVMTAVKRLLRDRATYISNHSYSGPNGKVPFSFSPVSNQGESIGKMNFVVQECLLDRNISNRQQKIQRVEESAVKYVIPKWFTNGDFTQPSKLYGDFYRVMDLEYIAHLFFLLSKCKDEDLKINRAQTYLKWAAQIFDVRVNPDLHDNERGKEESQMMGQYFLYIEDLLKALKDNGLVQEYKEISASWSKVTERIAQGSRSLKAAMTEHFFDNAGFGPAAGALALSGYKEEAKRYGELLKANIGFSNDFRSQSPDRWWEALSYMMHSLWGGVTAASALLTGKKLQDPELIQAAYRSTVAMLYLYDSNATATDRTLKVGEAASTYSIAGPNLNRPDLSRNRFGQSIFASNGGIFTKLFPDGYTGEDDWDMGEELVAYLNGFGQETYVYEDQLGVHVINGRLEATSEGRFKIISSAPYPNCYIDLTHKNSLSSVSVIVDYKTGSGLTEHIKD
ncbi:hypothetical protein [Secundilactobacillus folii]|uniref:hypothetical protein n=1 Tax=Secundilactobacillus folii TaxID=2678357 RepID=UPI001C12C46C|nr:hypothetical protein [Secundilactobacillus folii]